MLPPFATAAEQALSFSGPEISSGETIQLKDFRGKVVLVDFWASWCPPCLESLPAYERIYRELGNEMLEIIAVNVDENTQDGLAFLARQPVSYLVVADPEGIIGIPYGVRSLPRAFLIDQEGNIVKIYKRFKSGDGERLKVEIETLLE